MSLNCGLLAFLMVTALTHLFPKAYFSIFGKNNLRPAVQTDSIEASPMYSWTTTIELRGTEQAFLSRLTNCDK